jgi:hypothetical protein
VFIISLFLSFFFVEKGCMLIFIHLVNLFFLGELEKHTVSNKNLVIKEKISGSGRTELSTFVVRVTHFTDLESENCTFQLLNIFRHLIIIYVLQVYKNTQ